MISFCFVGEGGFQLHCGEVDRCFCEIRRQNTYKRMTKLIPRAITIFVSQDIVLPHDAWFVSPSELP
jgi:hypothetical protein